MVIILFSFPAKKVSLFRYLFIFQLKMKCHHFRLKIKVYFWLFCGGLCIIIHLMIALCWICFL